MKSENAEGGAVGLEPVVGHDYRKHAEFLTERVAELQRQVLIKHTTSVLEELHAQISDRDNSLAALRLAGGMLSDRLENLMLNNGQQLNSQDYCESTRQLVIKWDALIDDVFQPPNAQAQRPSCREENSDGTK